MGFSTLRDALAEKRVPCKVHGCDRTWIWRGDEQAKAWARGEMIPPARMCDECYARSGDVADRTLPCSKPGCEGTWIWTKPAQLAAFARADRAPGPPRGLCDACRTEVKQLPDREVPCRVRGCSRTWIWTGRAQVLAGAKDGSATPPATMCDDCHALFQKLKDAERPCRVTGCGRAWIYTRWAQLEAQASGKSEPPARMCDPCAALFDKLSDREIPCRTTGCTRTWSWKRGTQLDALVAAAAEVAKADREPPAPGAAALEPPSRMCADCARAYGELADRTLPCKTPGCKGAWVWKRGAQLQDRRKAERKAGRKAEKKPDHANGPAEGEAGDRSAAEAARSAEQKAEGKSHKAPSRFCDDCQKLLEKLADREAPCSNESCTRTWTWTRGAQLFARHGGGEGRGREPKPPRHMCTECAEFMKGRTTKTIACTRCGAEIHWPPQSQLMTFLGKWAEPTMCGGCRKESGRKQDLDDASHLERILEEEDRG